MAVAGVGYLSSVEPGTRICFHGRVYDVNENHGLADTGIVAGHVARTFVRKSDAIVDLTVRSSDGKITTIRGTVEHPFYVPEANDYVPMGELTPGTVLESDTGNLVTVAASTIQHGSFDVYNFEVEGLHNYYVSDDEVLVHNLCIRNSKLAGGFHASGVPFDAEGFPIFDSATDVDIEYTGTYPGDVRAANEAAGFESTPEGYSWHHHQNGRTMQLVDRLIHDATGHTGGFSLFKTLKNERLW